VTAILFVIGGPLAYFFFTRRGPRFDKKALKYPYELPEEMMDPDNEESLFSRRLSIEYLLNPPDPISFEDADVVKHALKKLSEAIGDPRNFFPEVFIICHLGKRGDDCERAGPGLFYAAALLKLCFGHGVPCFTTFLVPDKDEHHKAGRISQAASALANIAHVHHSERGDPHSAFLSRINDRDCLCRVVIIVETPELYEDQKCMEQIHAALRVSERSQEDICVIPLRFDSNIIAPEDRWESVKWAHNKKLDKMLALTNEALDCSNPIPQSGTIPETPKHLMTMLQILAGKQRRMVNWTPTHSPWETADHDAGWVQDWFSDMGFEPPPAREDSESDEEEVSPKSKKGKGGFMGMLRRSVSHASEKKHLSAIEEGSFDSEEAKLRKSRTSVRSNKSVKSALSLNPFKKQKSGKSVGFKNMDEQPTRKRGPSVWGGLFGGGKKEQDAAMQEVSNMVNNAGDEMKNMATNAGNGLFGNMFSPRPEGGAPAKEPEPPKSTGFMGGMFGGLGKAFGYGAQTPAAPEPDPTTEDEDEKENLVILVGNDIPEKTVGEDSNEVEDTSWMDVDEKDPDVKEWRQATMKVLDFGGPKKTPFNPSKSEPVKKTKPGAKAAPLKSSSGEDAAKPKAKAAKSKAKALPKNALSPGVKAKAGPKKVNLEVMPERIGGRTMSDPDITPQRSEAEDGEVNFGDLGALFKDSKTSGSPSEPSTPTVSAKKTAKSKSKAKAKAASTM
jgi:hypothetical protein